MSKFQIKKAERKSIFARIALDGPTGSGKTYSALSLAQGLKENKRILVIDTERSSADRYADDFDFDKIDMPDHNPETYIEALASVDPQVYGVVIVDSLSHAWMGKDGALEQVDRAAARSQSKNSFFAWRDVTPLHNRLVDALLTSQFHLIVTMRSKMAYEIIENEKGKKEPVRMGLAPVQREGVEYEFDIIGDLNADNAMVISKTRASFLNRAVIQKPGADLGRRILEWCGHVEPKEPTPTDDQLRTLATAAKAAGYSNDDVRALSIERCGSGPREITVTQYNDLLQYVQSNPKSEEKN